MNLFPYDSRFDFMRLRAYSLGVALLLLLVAVAAMSTRGFNFALDFTGGTVTELRFEGPLDVDAARSKLDDAGYDSAQVQTFGAANDILIRLQPAAGQENAAQTGGAVLDVLNSAENPGAVVRSDFVGPQIGKELAENGGLCLVAGGAGFSGLYLAAF
jgi:preprotein translocase subunit SecF